ncbi:AzlC family ABC transporter permease [Streptomyces boncukensis]|uniref:AzlC family ABC transporter permease n=1 Tax=Streptomyces boncukensis TaxID=2711219 RepID=A0A6G4WYQ4_9ACTN|nr:AzlC family ABC transporter permease [Streptomyces boncukensis]
MTQARERPSGRRAAYAAGARAAVPFTVAVFAFGISFGVLAEGAGFSALASGSMSGVVFVGSAQFAAVSVLINGGGWAAAVVTGTLLNLRYLVMGFAILPALRGGRARRSVESQLVIEESWAIASDADGRFDRARLLSSGAVLWVGWVAGTLLGALGPLKAVDILTLGLDAVSPVLFFLLLAPHLAPRQDGEGAGEGDAPAPAAGIARRLGRAALTRPGAGAAAAAGALALTALGTPDLAIALAVGIAVVWTWRTAS